jgi:hypothetical protein
MRRWRCEVEGCAYTADVPYATLASIGTPQCPEHDLDLVLLPIPINAIFVVSYTYDGDCTDVFLFNILVDEKTTEAQVNKWIEKKQTEGWSGVFHIFGAQDYELL